MYVLTLHGAKAAEWDHWPSRSEVFFSAAAVLGHPRATVFQASAADPQAYVVQDQYGNDIGVVVEEPCV